MDVAGHSLVHSPLPTWAPAEHEFRTADAVDALARGTEGSHSDGRAATQSERSSEEASRMKRHRFTPEQMQMLKTVFEQNPTPSTAELQALSSASGVPVRSCRLWFKNRRARTPGKRTASESRGLRAAGPSGTTDAVSSNASLPRSTSAWNAQAPSGDSQLEARMYNPVSIAQDLGPMQSSASQQDSTVDAAPRRRPKRPHERGRAAKPGAGGQSQSSPLISPRPDSVLRISPAYGALGQDWSNTGSFADNGQKEPAAIPDSNWRCVPVRSEPPAILQSPHRSTAMGIPPTPRLQCQRVYKPGEVVELLDSAGAARAWCPARIISADVSWPSSTESLLSAVEIAQDDGINRVCEYDDVSPLTKTAYEIAFLSADEVLRIRADACANSETAGACPANVQGAAAGGTGAMPEGPHRVVLGARLRPYPPPPMPEWRPGVGEAVEALLSLSHGRAGTSATPSASTSTAEQAAVDQIQGKSTSSTDMPSRTASTSGHGCCWTVGQVRNFLARKGFLVAFADGSDEWFHLDQLRPYAIWRGADHWQVKSKAPPAVTRRALGAAPPAESSRAEDSNAADSNFRALEAAQRLATLNASRSTARAPHAVSESLPRALPRSTIAAPAAQMYPHRAWYTHELSDGDDSEEAWSDEAEEPARDAEQGLRHPRRSSREEALALRNRNASAMRSSSTSPLTSPASAAARLSKPAHRFPRSSLPVIKKDSDRALARKRKRHRTGHRVNEETRRMLDQTEIVAGQNGLVVGAGATDRRHRGGRKPSLTLTLPPGWRLEEQIRKGGSLAGRIDRVYVSPDGRKFRSLKEVARFLDR
jgi:hypothetical protein